MPDPYRKLTTAVVEIATQARRIADALTTPVVEHVDADQTTDDAAPHDELWSLLDWTFWGAGMGDVLREPLADAMVASITPEQRADALRVMAAWEESGRVPVGRRAYEELKAERDRLAAALRKVLGTFGRMVTPHNGEVLGYQGPAIDPAMYDQWRAVLDQPAAEEQRATQ